MGLGSFLSHCGPLLLTKLYKRSCTHYQDGPAHSVHGSDFGKRLFLRLVIML